MAKALFHKNQRVYVKPVGTFAQVERVIPHWVKTVDEPLRVTYDVGLGREFSATELVSEGTLRQGRDDDADLLRENWRVLRMKNRWQAVDGMNNHPYPGTFPVVVTEEKDWGGWRVPGAEYDRNPQRIEYQARVISNSPQMVQILRQLVQLVADNPQDMPTDLMDQARNASTVLRHIYEVGMTEDDEDGSAAAA